MGDDWNYVIGWSSPWVVSYEVEAKEGTAIITYKMQDSTPQYYFMKELLRFGEENGELVVTEHFYSNTYNEEGKVLPVIYNGSRPKMDEAIFDYMWQSVEGFISNSKWSKYELNDYTFENVEVSTEKLDDTRARVTVDFDFELSYSNPFCDPDEIAYIKSAKEAGSSEYEDLYHSYFYPQFHKEKMRFVMDIQPGAEKIYEDTVYEESILLYVKEADHPLIPDDGKYIYAYENYYDILPKDAWYCSFQIVPSSGTMTVSRYILIQDGTGRTNNGSFAMPLGFGATVTVSDDSVILLGGPGEKQKRISAEEWKELIAKDMHGNQRYYTAVFKETADGVFEIVEAREGYWNIEVASVAETYQNNVPSGSPTASTTISRTFAMKDTLKQHFGIDITANGNLPVYTTANGIVMEAAFDAEKGNYVKINHLNGFTTLYAHLVDLEVKAGETVEKGQMLGRIGKTGNATGLQCHYEIQLNGIYQDPVDYL